MRTNDGRADSRPSTRSGGRSGLRFFFLSWLFLAVAVSGWSVTTPLFASPDEPAHVVKAAAVARGEWTGRTIEQPGTYFEIITGVQVPAYYADSLDHTECFLPDGSEPADCAPDFVADDLQTAEVQTWIGRYPPLYYAVVGLPSLMSDGTAAVLGMRIASAVLCSGFFALGLWGLRASRHGRLMVSAGWLAVTPTALFFSGVVNSSGLEIAAGFATWALLVPLVRDPAWHHVRGRLTAGLGAAVVLLNTRPGSGLLALIIAVCLVCMSTREFWRAAFERWRWVPAVVLGVGGAVCAGAWLLVVDPTESLGGIPDSKLADPAVSIPAAIGLTGRYVKEQLAVFGALNVTLHPALLICLGGCIGALVVAGLVRGRPGPRVALGLLFAATFVLPVVSQLPSAEDLGLIWQGRYGLPMSIGLPIVAMAAVVSRRGEDRVTVWAARLVTVGVSVVHVAALFWSLWRYGYGLGSPLFSQPLEWMPPGGWALPVAFVVAMVAMTLLVAPRLVPASLAWWRPRPVPVGEGTGGEVPDGDEAGGGGSTETDPADDGPAAGAERFAPNVVQRTPGDANRTSYVPSGTPTVPAERGHESSPTGR